MTVAANPWTSLAAWCQGDALATSAVKTDDELWEWVADTLGVVIPRKACFDGHTAPFDAFAEAFFAKTPISVWIGSRGFSGKSYLLAVLGITEALLLGADVRILGGSTDQSENVVRYTESFMGRPKFPPGMILSGRQPGVTKTRISLVNGGGMIALPASMTAVRGPHPSRLRVDECFIAGTRVAVPEGVKVIESFAPGDRVLSWKDGKIVEGEVLRTWDRGRRETIKLTVRTGSNLVCTPEHKILDGVEDKWVQASISTFVRTASFVEKWETGVGKIVDRVAFGRSRVYDIATTHGNYIVEGVIVHNCDELDWKVLQAALGQTMAAGAVQAQTVVSSTHHHADGTMTQVLKLAEERGWATHRWCFNCTSKTVENPTGWLAPSEVARKRQEVPAAMFEVEYNLSEPSPESRAIMPQSVEDMFQEGLGRFDGKPGEYIEIEAPVQGARYSTGADWANDVNWTDIVTLRYDVTPVKVVAWERRGREPYPIMAGCLDKRATRYPGRVFHDQTGVGNGLHDFLNCNATGVVLVGRRRTDLLSSYITAIEGGRIVAPRIAHVHGEHRYCASDDLWGDGHLPDSVCSHALAWSGVSQGGLGQPDTGPEYNLLDHTELGGWDRLEL